jgi:trafficking protein particle complex subunit 8
VTTRTTALAPVQHGTFNLRFSELEEIERACAEDDDRRALRTLDWISARIQRKCAAWVAEKLDEETPQRRAPVVDARPDDAGAGAGLRVVDEGGRGGLDGHPDEGNGTPWWDELRACAEGLAVPSHEEGWNHPAAGASSME